MHRHVYAALQHCASCAPHGPMRHARLLQKGKVMSAETNAFTAETATLPDALPLRGLTLVGTFGKDGRGAALVRLPSGKIRRLEPGDTLRRFRVRAIEPGRVILESQGQATALDWPEPGNNAA